MKRAVVIFEDNNDHPLGTLLKRGYRHVWCAITDDRGLYWVSHNLRLTKYSVEVQAAADFDLAAYYRDQGLEVVELTVPHRRMPGWITASSCVGVVKQLLGLRSFALTPWQLYRHLANMEQPMRLNLSALSVPPGISMSAPKPPPPPPPPAAPQPTPTPRDVQESRAMRESRSRARRQQGVAGSLRTSGGAMGQAVQQYQLASKQLTGQ